MPESKPAAAADSVIVLAASPRLFESAVLDKLSRVHPITPVLVYVPIILLLSVHGYRTLGTLLSIGWTLFGFLGWTLTEYLGHRFLFHRVLPLPFGLGERVQFLIHGVHHDHPHDSRRLVMPPLLSGIIMSIAAAIIWLVFGGSAMWPILAGFMAGYLGYDCIHYRLHHAKPRTRVGRLLRMRHMHHHFHDETKGFGVMSVWWDDVFGTQHSLRTRQAPNARSR